MQARALLEWFRDQWFVPVQYANDNWGKCPKRHLAAPQDVRVACQHGRTDQQKNRHGVE